MKVVLRYQKCQQEDWQEDFQSAKEAVRHSPQESLGLGHDSKVLHNEIDLLGNAVLHVHTSLTENVRE